MKIRWKTKLYQKISNQNQLLKPILKDCQCLLVQKEIVEGIPGEKPAEIPGDKPEGVAGEKHEGLPEGENAGIPEEEKPEFKPEISDDLAQKIQEELDKKKEAMGKKTITREEFIKSLQDKRAKIVYHALWYLTFIVDDHASTKAGMYEVLKEITSKDALEPIGEQKFYFGLKPILNMKLFDQKVVSFVKDKIKIMVNVDNLQDYSP